MINENVNNICKIIFIIVQLVARGVTRVKSWFAYLQSTQPVGGPLGQAGAEHVAVIRWDITRVPFIPLVYNSLTRSLALFGIMIMFSILSFRVFWNLPGCYSNCWIVRHENIGGVWHLLAQVPVETILWIVVTNTFWKKWDIEGTTICDEDWIWPIMDK